MAERLRCSPVTVARAIQKLIDAKLIAETGQLHQGRYKFYHVRWGRDENIKAASKKITKPVRKVEQPKFPLRKRGPEGFDEEQSQKNPPTPFSKGGESTSSPVADELSAPSPTLPPLPPPSTIMPQAILKDSRIAYYAEIARKRHQENRQLHQSILLSLR
jgi:hypothetical protein